MRHPVYTRTQWLGLLWVLLPTINLAVVATLLAKTGTVDWVPVVILLTLTVPVLLFLGRFSVAVGEGELEWQFGFVGWPRWRLPLTDIASASPTRTNWLDGWGIRATTTGMLYNATGFGAVRLQLRSGRTLRLGSDEPERLAGFITARLPAPPPGRTPPR